MTQSAEDVARGLTKRQRLDVRRIRNGRSVCRTSGKFFIAEGLANASNPLQVMTLTPLGLRVAALLKEE